MPLKIGPYVLPSNVVLAPMAGVTDRPFRMLCRKFGAGLAASEMLTSDARLWDTPKSRRRMDHRGEPESARRADRRLRSRDDGRRGAAQRRCRRRNHRHQHGLSGEESLQPPRGFGTDAG